MLTPACNARRVAVNGTAKGSRWKSGAAPATVTGDGPLTPPLVESIYGLTNWEGERDRSIRESGDLPF
jgi:hypothetical protein